jgi:hypothetical protein
MFNYILNGICCRFATCLGNPESLSKTVAFSNGGESETFSFSSLNGKTVVTHGTGPSSESITLATPAGLGGASGPASKTTIVGDVKSATPLDISTDSGIPLTGLQSGSIGSFDSFGFAEIFDAGKELMSQAKESPPRTPREPSPSPSGKAAMGAARPPPPPPPPAASMEPKAVKV